MPEQKQHQSKGSQDVPLWPVCFDDVFYGPSADRTARIDLSLEFEAAVVAEAHVSTGVDDRVHILVKAYGALPVFTTKGQLRDGQSGRDLRTERGAGGRHQGGLGGGGGAVHTEGQVRVTVVGTTALGEAGGRTGLQCS